MTARDAILARIREAHAADRPGAEPGGDVRSPGYRVAGALPPEARLERFVARVQEYGVRVTRCTPDGVGATVAGTLRSRRAARVVVPDGVPDAWCSAPVTWLRDAAGGLDLATLSGVDGVLTGCAVAIAETGTLVLDGGEAQGRRALTLVPDFHLCVLAAEQLVETVPEAVRRLEGAAREGRPITFVSGPSATSDIELSRVAGVHGPRTLDIVLVAPEPRAAAEGPPAPPARG